MEQESNKEKKIKASIDATTGLVQAIPVYQDTIQPAAKQVGQSLEVIAKTVNIALAPVKALVWGYDKIENFINARVSEKLQNIPQENITTPPPQIAVPAAEALRYSGHDPNLRELYANLIANAMDKDTIHKAHPAFVEVIKNMSSDEAILLKAFITKHQLPIIDIQATVNDGTAYTTIIHNYSHIPKIVSVTRADLVSSYINNICRLGILEVPALVAITTPNTYEPLENDKDLEEVKYYIKNIMERKVNFSRKVLRTTSFGQQFIENVVKDK